MKQIATIIALLTLSFANVQAQKILKPKWSTAHVGTVAHFNNSGTKMLTCGGNGIDVWDNSADTLLYTFTNSERIVDAKFCSNDYRIAAITGTGFLLIIDAESGETISKTYNNGLLLKSIAISKGGDLALVLTRGNMAFVSSVHSGSIISTIYAESEILGVKFSNNDSYVIFRLNNKAEVFNTQTGALINVFPHSGFINNAEFAKGDKRILTVSLDNGMKIWDFVTGKVLYTSPEKSTTLAEFSQNGKYFYYVADYKIIVKDVSTGETVSVFTSENLPRGILSVHFNNSGEYIINTDFDGTAKLWNVKTGKLSHVFPMKSQHDARDCEFESSGTRFLTISKYGIVSVWDTVTKTKVVEHFGYSGEISHPEFKFSDKKIFVVSNDLSVKLWNTESGNLEFVDFQFHDIGNDKFVQYCSNNTCITQSIYTNTRIWDMNSLRITHEFPIIASFPQFLPNCTNVIYRNLQTNQLEVFDIDTKSTIKQLEESKSTYNKLRISTNGDFVTGWEGTRLHIWSLQSGKHLHTIDLGSSKVGFTDFADNKTIIVQTSSPNELLWIDVEQGRIIYTRKLYRISDITQLSKDKSKVITITEQKNINIREAQTGTLLRTIKIDNAVFSVDISGDGSLILTTEENGINIYNSVTLEKIAQSEGFGTIVYAKFNETADRIVTADNDGTIRVWDVSDLMTSTNSNDYANNYNLSVSPNPATDEITIKGINSDLPVAYTFTDILGTVITHGIIPEQTDAYTLSTGNLPSGFYNITFQTNGANHTEKLTVVH